MVACLLVLREDRRDFIGLLGPRLTDARAAITYTFFLIFIFICCAVLHHQRSRACCFFVYLCPPKRLQFGSLP